MTVRSPMRTSGVVRWTSDTGSQLRQVEELQKTLAAVFYATAVLACIVDLDADELDPRIDESDPDALVRRQIEHYYAIQQVERVEYSNPMAIDIGIVTASFAGITALSAIGTLLLIGPARRSKLLAEARLANAQADRQEYDLQQIVASRVFVNVTGIDAGPLSSAWDDVQRVISDPSPHQVRVIGFAREDSKVTAAFNTLGMQEFIVNCDPPIREPARLRRPPAPTPQPHKPMGEAGG